MSKEMKTEEEIAEEVNRQLQLRSALLESEHGGGCMTQSEFESLDMMRIKADAKIDALNWVLP